MMETILDCLSLELTAAIPENKTFYHKLLKSSEKLKENRLKHIEEKVFNNLAEEFEHSVETVMSKALKNTGFLLVSAVIDENNGITGALSGVQKWLVNVDNFSSAWVGAVEQTIHKANDIVSQQRLNKG